MREKIAAPELIAPAGNWDCVRAAAENGADAVYFGLESHNARMRAANFSLAALPELASFLHGRGMRGYVTFNTLVFPNEMSEAEDLLRGIIQAGIDAAIVQDIGICRLIRSLSPDFPIHASTQMTITSAAGVSFARELGCSSVTIARECSIKDIELIRTKIPTGGAAAESCGIEAFVHGALCVAFSGQCLTSESLGGRSANRGVCAQACRMPYELVADGVTVNLGDQRYLLSPRDLAGLALLPAMMRAGVSALKIEGRLKTPEYVANVTCVYRKALDLIVAALEQGQDWLSAAELARNLAEEARYDLEMAFSRGLYTGWLEGTNNRELVHGRFAKKRGVFLGEVTRICGHSIYVTRGGPLKPGDGVVFDAGKPDEDEEGGRVYEVADEGNETRIEFGRRDVNFRKIRVGDKLWKTSDPELDRRLRQSFSGEPPRFRRPVTFEISGRAGQPLVIELRDELGNSVRCESSLALVTAEKQPLTTRKLREQIGRLGGTHFSLGEMDNRLEGEVMLPLSELNRMRRDAVSRLELLRKRPRCWTLTESLPHLPFTGQSPVGPEYPEAGRPHKPADLVVLVRNMAQLAAVLDAAVATIYCEFEDPKKYRDAVALFRSRAQNNSAGKDASIWVAPPRIFKPGEEWILRLVRSSDADGYLVRNYDHLSFFEGSRRIGDYSLNVANPLSAHYYIGRWGLERVTASYDLNAGQLDSLLTAAPPSWFEVTIHQHMPMFHMEHCIYCAFLSDGSDYTNCGRPCDRRDVRLKDRVGAEHFLKADAGCRNTVFNSRAQTGSENAARLMVLGLRTFRIELMDESPEEALLVIERYRKLLSGEISGTQLWRQLKLQNQLGVTRGPSLG